MRRLRGPALLYWSGAPWAVLAASLAHQPRCPGSSRPSACCCPPSIQGLAQSGGSLWAVTTASGCSGSHAAFCCPGRLPCQSPSVGSALPIWSQARFFLPFLLVSPLVSLPHRAPSSPWAWHQSTTPATSCVRASSSRDAPLCVTASSSDLCSGNFRLYVDHF